MSVYGRVEEVHKENREPLEYQIEQESHHRESSRLPLVKILLLEYACNGDNSRSTAITRLNECTRSAGFLCRLGASSDREDLQRLLWKSRFALLFADLRESGRIFLCHL